MTFNSTLRASILFFFIKFSVDFNKQDGTQNKEDDVQKMEEGRRKEILIHTRLPADVSKQDGNLETRSMHTKWTRQREIHIYTTI